MTNNQLVEAKGDFLTNPQLLNSGIIRKYLDPQGKASDEELAYFIAQAKAQNLNPFTKEKFVLNLSEILMGLPEKSSQILILQ